MNISFFGQLIDHGLQVDQELFGTGEMQTMKLGEFQKNGIAGLTAVMPQDLVPREDNVRQSREFLGDANTDDAFVGFPLPLQVGLAAEEMVIHDEVVGDAHQSRSQASIGAACESTIGQIDSVALIPAGETDRLDP